MMGSDIDDAEGKGIIPRIVEQIFASILASPGNIEYTVRVSYMEIYMERIRDLLQPQNDNLPIHEEKNKGVYVKNLLAIYVSSVGEVYEVMKRGGASRAVAATNMNQESSRSHSIFVIEITQTNVETGSSKSGRLFLVDLAGSEKVGKTGASGQTLEEAKKINKSLSALGMVINALTDGKSSHVPYRDSKLTRILQESLGGNSRTTLIINCSPSGYNLEETLGTLRFGVRAKAIKNKAKINAELSPAELKALLKKAQTQVTTYENYLASLEGEVKLWRGGDSVPKESWAPPLAGDGVSGIKSEARAPRPGTPSLLQAERSETPSRSESRMGDRAGTPSIILEKDEREEFFRRENELQDQLAEKETQFAAAESGLQAARDELKAIKDTSSRGNLENEKLGHEINELKMQLERIAFESKEANITMDGLKEANSELTSELDDVKQQLLEAKMNAKETSAIMDEKERKKHERMAQMMAGFDMSAELSSDNEKLIRRCIEDVQTLWEASASGEVVPPERLEELKSYLAEAQNVVRQADLSVAKRIDSDDDQARRREEAETRLAAVQHELQQILEGNLSDADIEDVKARLGKAYGNSQEIQQTTITGLRRDLSLQAEENQQLRVQLDDSERRAKVASTNGVASPNGKTIQQQIADFDAIKKSLMRDLQNRCERVVELEVSLDETRDQYNNILRTSNNRAQQKKMAFLERNLEQLTQVQRQLVEQNGGLKKEVAIAERKLIARNDRILSLEALLTDSQEKLTAANHRCILSHPFHFFSFSVVGRKG